MIHVSSAYVNSYLLETHEKLYDKPEDTEKVISLVDTLNDEALQTVEPKLLKTHPNTYTFTKHLAEHEVASYAEKFPCTIVRPSMIVATWKEPVPGWTCSKVGPQGFLMGASKGVVRRLPLAKENIADYIPVDVVVNQLLVAGFHAAKQKTGLSIYHCTSSTQKPFRWQMIEDEIGEIIHKYPLKSAVWYPHLKFVNSLMLFRISALIVHFIPAILLDLMLRVTGGRPILFRLHKNVWNSLNRLERFIFTEWKFHNTNSIELASQLNQTDSKLFYIDISNIVWKDYFTTLHLGVRRYLNNEKRTTLDAARSKQMFLLALHVVWQILFMSLLWYLVSVMTGLTMTQSAWSIPPLYILYCFL